MRDMMFLAGFLSLIPLAFSSPLIAYLVWGWTAIISIDSYLYGFMSTLRYNLIFGIIAISILVFRYDAIRKNKSNGGRTSLLLILFLAQASVSSALGYEGNPLNTQLYENLFKVLVFVLIMPFVVVERYKIHAFLIMLCLGLGFHGIVDGMKYFASGGAHLVRGFAKFGDNNHFAVSMAMIIPILLYLSRYSALKTIRICFFLSAILNAAAVIGTHSRGGAIALLASSIVFILASRRRVAGALFALGCLSVIAALATADWVKRMETIQSAGDDVSFLMRIEAWQVSSAIALANPIAGGGLHAVQAQSVWEKFSGSKGILPFIDVGFTSPTFRAAHSIYFEVLGDMGFIGILLFLIILANTLLGNRHIKILTRGREEEYSWAIDLSRALVAAIIAFMVGGLTVSLAYSEILYMIVMLHELLRREVISLITTERNRGAA